MTDIVKGSIQSVAKGDLALALMNAKIVLICDRSGSMSQCDALGGQARYMVEDDIVTRLQAKHPGEIALVAFADSAELRTDGRLPVYALGGSTNMVAGLELAHPLVMAGARAVLISDGLPSNAEFEVFNAARKLSGSLDCIYVGPENEDGYHFLKRLAAHAGGTADFADIGRDPALLEAGITRLLLAAATR